MLSRQVKISQVKCNFCMEWMCLNTQTKFNINICDPCLELGCQDKNLKAVSSQGQLYQVYMVKQNAILQPSKNQKTAENWFNDSEDEKQGDEEDNQKVEFLEEIDQFRNSQIKDILTKWTILTSFLKQKQSLSSQEIEYLKNICAEKSTDFKKLNEQFATHILNPTHQNIQKPVQKLIFQNIQQDCCNDQISVNKQVFNRPVKTNLPSIEDIENFWATDVKQTKTNQQQQSITNNYNCRSPVRVALGERDLNSVHVSLCKLNNLVQNSETSAKKINTSFYDEDFSLNSSFVKTSMVFAHNSIRSSRGGQTFSSLTKRSNNQHNKKLEAVRSRIGKYLQKNYDSNSLSRLMFSVVLEAFQNTSVIGKSLELVSYNLSFIDFKCYLQAFDWKGIEVLKLVKTKLIDDQFKALLDFISVNKLQIKILVLTNNKLTQGSIHHLQEHELESVRQVYLGKNRIMKGRVRDTISSLRSKISLYL